jgi:S-adenosylmethionine synthetase
LAQLKKAIEKTFAFSVSEMIQELRLTTPFFQTTAHGGHFGREEFPWEQLPHLDALVRFL